MFQTRSADQKRETGGWRLFRWIRDA